MYRGRNEGEELEVEGQVSGDLGVVGTTRGRDLGEMV